MPVNSWLYVIGGTFTGSAVASWFLPAVPMNTNTTAPYEALALYIGGLYYFWPTVQSFGEFVGPMGAMVAFNAAAPFYIKLRG